jgi:hypothetical protein
MMNAIEEQVQEELEFGGDENVAPE